MSRFVCRESRTPMVCFAAAAVAAVTVAAPAQAQTSWNAYNDFYLSPTAAGWGGATSPSATGAAWGYYMGNVNGVGAYPNSIGTYLTTSESLETTQLYRFSSVNPLDVPGPVRSQSVWTDTGGAGFARYVDNVDWSGTGVETVPHSSLGSYPTPWFPEAPGLGDGPGGSNLTNLIWMQSAYLSGTSSPSGEGIASVLTWTAPATRIYDFSGLFVSGNDPTRSAAVAITDSLGGAAPLSRTVLANDTVQSFSFSKAYTAGDVVQFQVGNNLSSGNIVGLQVSIVPEPSTWVMGLAGIACAGWGAFRSRKRAVRQRAVAHPAAMLAVLFIALLTNPAHAVTIELVPVGNAGNANDTTGYGGVAYEYQIGKYDVTIGQYAAFLNAVAATDTYSLYNTSMATDLNSAGISRSGSSGSYTYSVMNNSGDSANRPITYVSWWDAARFANWMANGQPTGAQSSTTTENGAYNVNGATSGNAPAKNATNPNTSAAPTFYIPTENEWYKAAYYSPNYGGTGVAGYFDYATQSDTAPGNTIGPGANQANYYAGDYSVTQSSTYSAGQNYLTDVGAFTNSESFYGTFDQSGNVWQWNDLDGTAGSSRGLRGGAWGSLTADRLSSSARELFDPSDERSWHRFSSRRRARARVARPGRDGRPRRPRVDDAPPSQAN